MRRLLILMVALVAAGSIGTALAGQGQSKVTVCHKTSSKTKPYQRIVVSGAALAAHQKHAADIVPAPRNCPTALLTATSGGVAIDVNLLGVNEQPDPGDPDGSGTATLRLRAGQAQVCFSLSVRDIVLPATGAHIHRGSAEDSGPVVVPLGTPNASGSASGCVGAPRALVTELLASRSSFYVNVHSNDFPNGAVRGQLALAAPNVVLRAAMTGANERPNAGDPDGSGVGALRFVADKGRLCYTLAVRNIQLPTVGAHIHRGTAEQAGPVIIPLQQPLVGGTSSGCVNVEAALLREIAQNPAGFYANVHTPDYPGGAVRAQLTAAP